MLQDYVPTQWVNGTAPAINAANLNHIEDGIKDVTDEVIELNESIQGLVPVGSIIAFKGLVVPVGWALCDGSGGTPNLVDKFIMGSDITDDGSTGGYEDSILVSHNHNGLTGYAGEHSHTERMRGLSDPINSYTGGPWALPDSSQVTQTTGSAGNHRHTISAAGESGAGRNIPPYVKLAYIMKIS